MTSSGKYSIRLLATAFVFCVAGVQAQVQMQTKPGIQTERPATSLRPVPASVEIVAPSATPAAPTGVTATPGNAQVSVAFTAPSPSVGITAYTATCVDIVSGTTAQPASGASSPLTVSGLINSTAAYRCKVKARNAAGFGPDSVASNSAVPFAPVADVPRPDAPTIGTATAGNAQVSVTFTAPSSNGGAAITEYLVTCNKNGVGGTEGSGRGSASPLTVSGLVNGTAYTCKVSASTAKDYSVRSAASNSVTPRDPAAPPSPPGAPIIGTATAGDGQVRVTYTAPSNTGGSPITRYVGRCTSLPYMSLGTNDRPDSQDISGAVRPLTVFVSALNGRAYTCTVRAGNLAGEGPYSAASNSVTPVGPPARPPGAPTNVSVRAGTGEAIVTFNGPRDLGLPTNGLLTVLTYRAICGTRASGGVAGAMASEEGQNWSLTVKGLNRGTEYICKVAAKNVAGFGMESTESNSVTPD